MSHAVWMDFPNNRRGRALKWVFTTALDGKAKLYDHTNKELVFFKDRIESSDMNQRSRHQLVGSVAGRFLRHSVCPYYLLVRSRHVHRYRRSEMRRTRNPRPRATDSMMWTTARSRPANSNNLLR